MPPGNSHNLLGRQAHQRLPGGFATKGKTTKGDAMSVTSGNKIQLTAISKEAAAQARYALFAKSIQVKNSLEVAQEVFEPDSANVVFWKGELDRVTAALKELADA